MLEDLARALFEEETGGMTDAHCAALQRVRFVADFPILDIGFEAPGMVPLRIRVDARSYNAQAPGVTLCSWNGEPLPTLPRSGGIFNPSAHAATGRPFICMAGVHEYHIHSSHLGDTWAQYRNDRTLAGIVFQIQQGWWQTWKE